MVNVVVRVEALGSEVHSGMFGGPAPDALAALIEMLASLRDEGATRRSRGSTHRSTWHGEAVRRRAVPHRRGRARRRRAARRRQRLGHAVGAARRHVLGIDCPPVVGSAAAIVPRAAARLNLRVPPGTEGERRARRARGAPARRGPVGCRRGGRDRGDRIARSRRGSTGRPSGRWRRRCGRRTARR